MREHAVSAVPAGFRRTLVGLKPGTVGVMSITIFVSDVPSWD